VGRRIKKTDSNEENLKILLISANTETINMPVLPLGLGDIAASVQKAGHDLNLLNLLEQKVQMVVDLSMSGARISNYLF
jgi:hypothetical protein